MVLGFRAHSGWAAMVAVAGSPIDAPQILERRRIVHRRSAGARFEAAVSRRSRAAAAG